MIPLTSSYEHGHCLISVSRRVHIIVKMFTDHCLNKYILNKVTFKQDLSAKKHCFIMGYFAKVKLF